MKAWLAFRCFQVCQQLLRWGSWLIMQLRLWWWGVEGASSARFFGLMYVHRHPTGRLLLGRGLVFRSNATSNNIGVNRRCQLSVGPAAVLQVGDQCGFSATVITAQQSVVLGDRVMCGANVTITDGDRHPLDSLARAAGDTGKSAAVCIGNDVWLGLNVVVLKGVTIGEGTVVGAGSVVTESLPANVLAAGNPARVIRTLP